MGSHGVPLEFTLHRARSALVQGGNDRRVGIFDGRSVGGVGAL
jgi:hypothetical protein